MSELPEFPPSPPATARKDSGPENLSDVLGRLFVARGWGRLTERTQLETAWRDVAGEEFAPHTRVGGLKRGILEIEVRNAVLIQELTQFHKRRLLTDLRKQLPRQKITDLKFRAAAW